MSIVKVDARAAGYVGDPVRVLAVTMADSGKILVNATADWKEPTFPRDDTVVITDTPQVFNHWSMAFIERDNMKDLMRAYMDVKRSGLLKINDNVRMYDPSDIVQPAKMDERGQSLEFDEGITNGHVAVLLAVWGARQAYAGYVLTERAETPFDDNAMLYDDDVMMPFSVGV